MFGKRLGLHVWLHKKLKQEKNDAFKLKLLLFNAIKIFLHFTFQNNR